MWTPGYRQVGTHDVTFSVSDGRGGTDSEIITITVIMLDNDIDGLPDNWETIYFSDIADCVPDQDPDGDASDNQEEYDRETNPTNPDTDGDGIPDGQDNDPLSVPAPFRGGCSAGAVVAFAFLAALLRRRDR